MALEKKILHQGKLWYSVPAAARMLRTTTAKVREAMGRGGLEWTQRRANGSLIFSIESLLGYEAKVEASKRTS